MAKKFMYVCVGILVLTVAFLLGARYGSEAHAHQLTSDIVAFHCAGDGYMGFVLLENGEAWSISTVDGWSTHGLPVPGSQIKFFAPYGLVTTSNEVWLHDAIHYPDVWRNYGSPPGGVATQPATWGSIKAQFK